MSELASDTAMLMAAGLGKRMRPLTASTPKPLVRVAGKPLIDRALDRLEEAGIAKAVVNVHYLADAIEAHIGPRTAPAVTFSDEREHLLETGGGMVKVVLSGKGEMKGLTIDPNLIDPEDAEVLEDLIIAAHNDAKTKSEEMMAEEMKAVTGGLQLPPGMKMPF